MRFSEAKNKLGERDKIWADLILRPTGQILTKEQYEYIKYYEKHALSHKYIAEIPFEEARGKYLHIGNYFGGAAYYFWLSDEPEGKDMIYNENGMPKGYSSHYNEFSYGKYGKIEFD